MSNILDYISWRGDLSFEASPCNEVDNFIFCMASYVDFNRTYESYNPDVKISIKNAAVSFCESYDLKALRQNIGTTLPWNDIRRMMSRMSKSKRFADVGISDFVNIIDPELQMQFSAVVYHISEEEMFVAFRGTDGTLIGWKEDLRLSYLNNVPAQTRAAEYLCTVAGKYPSKRIIAGGHSKGGNLAKFAAVHAGSDIRERISVVYNNDGPGFLPDGESGEGTDIEGKIRNYMPQSSFVGQMLSHKGQINIVKSVYLGVYQHDIFGWEILGNRAVRAKQFTRVGEKNHEIFGMRINCMPLDERREVVDVLCQIVDATGAKTLSELSEARLKHTASLLKSFSRLGREQKQLMFDFISILFASSDEK